MGQHTSTVWTSPAALPIMNKLVQVALCVVFAAAVSAKPGYLGLAAPYAAHVAAPYAALAAPYAALAAAEHSGAYIHDPSGDHALPYIHDARGDVDLHSARLVAAVPAAVAAAHVPYAAALPYAAGIHAVPAAVVDTPAVAAARAAHLATKAALLG